MVKRFIKEVLYFIDEDAMHLHAAAISFFAIFAFIPLLVTTYLLLNNVSGSVANELLLTTSEALGTETTNTLLVIAADLQSVEVTPTAYVVGIFIVLYAMTRLMYFLQKSMNKLWNAKPHPKLLNIEVQHRIISVISVFALIILTTIISLQTIAISELSRAFGPGVARTLFFVAAALAMYSLFAFLYKFVPDREIKWSDVVGGSIFSTVLFWAGYIVIRQAFQYSFVENIYATISYVLLAFIWVYVFAQIFYIGAEICKVYALHYGSLKKNKKEFRK